MNYEAAAAAYWDKFEAKNYESMVNEHRIQMKLNYIQESIKCRTVFLVHQFEEKLGIVIVD